MALDRSERKLRALRAAAREQGVAALIATHVRFDANPSSAACQIPQRCCQQLLGCFVVLPCCLPWPRLIVGIISRRCSDTSTRPKPVRTQYLDTACTLSCVQVGDLREFSQQQQRQQHSPHASPAAASGAEKRCRRLEGELYDDNCARCTLWCRL